MYPWHNQYIYKLYVYKLETYKLIILVLSIVFFTLPDIKDKLFRYIFVQKFDSWHSQTGMIENEYGTWQLTALYTGFQAKRCGCF